MKKHTLMRIVSAAMTAAIAFTSYAGTVSFAAEKTAQTAAQKEEAMKAALTKVKKRVTVPAAASEFKYSADRNYSTDCYHFTWSTPAESASKTRETVNINIVGDIITSYKYNKYYFDDDDPKNNRKQSFAKLSDAQMISKAKEHMKKLNPDIYNEADYTVRNISLFGNEATINFDRRKNGIIVDGNGGSITIDKDTGELFSCSVTWFRADTKFDDASKKLSSAKAVEALKSLCTLTPAYTISYNWEKDEKEAILVYRPDFTDEIDAFTGKKSTIWEDMQKDKGSSNPPWSWANSYHTSNTAGMADEAFDDDAEDAGSGEGAEISFTEAELREIQSDKDVLSKEQVKQLLCKDKYIKMPEYVPLERSKLYKNETTGEYFYNMYYANDEEDIEEDDGMAVSSKTAYPYYELSVTLNAKTGKIISFSRSSERNLDDTKKYPVAANSKIAENAIAYFYPDIYKEYKADERNSAPANVWYSNVKYDPKLEDANPATGSANSKQQAHYETTRTYYFSRYVNGVIVEGDTIRVIVDNKGNVYSANYTHTEVKFPPVPKFDNNKAFEQLFKQQPLLLYYDGYYKPDGSIKTYLVYKTDDFTLDSKYRLVSYNGRIIESSKKEDTEYIDIKGSKYEKAITTLARYGITLPSENNEFKPNAALTDKEFAIIVYGALNSYVPYSISNGGYGGKDTKPVTLTNAEAAKVFVTAAGGAEYAELKNIYKAPYSDVPASNTYVGYISIAKAKGYMKGSGGKFEPNTKVSRGRAMQIVYDYIEGLK